MPKLPPHLASSPRSDDGAHVSDHVQLEADLLNETPIPATTGYRPEDPDTARGRVILIVDDDGEMRLYLKRCLMKAGTTDLVVIEAADGQEALEYARRGGIDLVISDIVMPKMDGLALCRAFQADEALRPLPVLLITGEGPLARLPGGVVGVLAKPFSAATLWAAVRPLLA